VDPGQLEEMIRSKEAHANAVILESVSPGAISKSSAYSSILLVTHVMFTSDETPVVYSGWRYSRC
jgi:hypothetical protein